MATHKLYFAENYLFVTRLSDNVNVYHYPSFNSIGFRLDGRCYLEHVMNANNHIRFGELISELVDEDNQPWTELNLYNTLVARTGVDVSSSIMFNGAVDDYNDLLAIASPTVDSLYYVRNTIFTGVWPFRTERVKGVRRYTGSVWERGNLPDNVITENEHGAPSHDPLVPYYEGNLIYHNDTLMRCKANIPAKAFDPADWDETGSKFIQATNITTDSAIYKHYEANGAWTVLKYDRTDNLSVATANAANNPTVTTLVDAVTGVLTLNYS